MSPPCNQLSLLSRLPASAHHSQLPVQSGRVSDAEEQHPTRPSASREISQRRLLVRQQREVLHLKRHSQFHHSLQTPGAAAKLQRLPAVVQSSYQRERQSGDAVCLQGHRSADYEPLRWPSYQQVSVLGFCGRSSAALLGRVRTRRDDSMQVRHVHLRGIVAFPP